MKPAPFEYIAPTTIDEALVHLGEFGYEAKVLAGGQSLIPMMNFRLAQPSIILDLTRASQVSERCSTSPTVCGNRWHAARP